MTARCRYLTTEVETYWARIYVGLQDGRTSGILLDGQVVRTICQDYCDSVGLCVTVTDTNFIYTDGCEPGVIVGLINYPRFPCSRLQLRNKALALAGQLCSALKQCGVSVVFPDRTVWIHKLIEKDERG